MQVSTKGLNLIKKYESLKLKAYLDVVKILTIGYGTTNSVLPDGHKITINSVWTEKEADYWLDYAINQVFLPSMVKYIKVDLTQDQFDAVVCFVYNCGLGNFISSTLLKKINLKDFDGAQKEFLKWNRAQGKVLRGLTRRRLEEAVFFGSATREELIEDCLDGVYPEIK